MKSAISPSSDVVSGTVTRNVRLRLRFMVIGCACLLGVGLLLVQQWGGGKAFLSDATATPGVPQIRLWGGMSPNANRLQALAGLPSAGSRPVAFRRSLAAQLESIRAMSDQTSEAEMLENLVGSISVEDLPNALAFLDNQKQSELIQALAIQLLRRWTEGNPVAAATWIGTQSGGANRQEEINAVALVWADQSFSESLAWVRGLAESAEVNAALVALGYEAARSAPMDAFQMAAGLPDGEVRDDLIRHTARQWTDKNPQEAVAWARQVEDKTLSQELLADITTAWADKEPASAATAAADLIPPGRSQDDAVIGIVQRWVQTEPAQAADWVMKFQKGQLQETAVEELVKLWADQDPVRTGEWINQLEGAQRDSAVAAFVGKLALGSPDSAAKWAATIADESLRNRMKEKVEEASITAEPEATRR